MVLPLIQIYVVFLFFNQLTQEDLFSQASEFLKTLLEWILKTTTAILVGLQTIQCLVAPAVDTLKNSTAHRIVKALPGVGGLMDFSGRDDCRFCAGYQKCSRGGRDDRGASDLLTAIS